MRTPLDDSVLRFERAKRRLDALEENIGAFFKEAEKDLLRADVELKGDSYDARWFCATAPITDIWWPVDIGEILYHLRSCLDFMAYGFGGHQFPIFKTCKGYHAQRTDGTPRPQTGDWHTSGMHHLLADAIEAEQPYNVYPEQPLRDPLVLLDRFRNWDAHADSHTIEAALIVDGYEPIAGEFTGERFRRMKPGPLHDGIQVARFTGKLVRPAPPNAKVRLKTSLTIAFAEGSPARGELVGPVLADIYNRVSGIGERLREVWRQTR